MVRDSKDKEGARMKECPDCGTKLIPDGKWDDLCPKCGEYKMDEPEPPINYGEVRG